MKTSITVSVEVLTVQEVEEISKAHGVSRSNFVDNALKNYMDLLMGSVGEKIRVMNQIRRRLEIEGYELKYEIVDKPKETAVKYA